MLLLNMYLLETIFEDICKIFTFKLIHTKQSKYVFYNFSYVNKVSGFIKKKK